MGPSVWVGALLGALCVLGFSGCGDDQDAQPNGRADEPATERVASEPATEPVAHDPAADQAAPTPVGGMMRGHFTRAVDARNALIRADLDRARADMAWLATHEDGEALPENLQPLLVAMQTQAATFADATTLTEAGTSFARTLVRCGACHTAGHTGPQIAVPPIPEGDTTVAHMQRHRWAADRMFDGLVTASAETFLSGTDALADVPLHHDQLPGAEGHPPPQVEALSGHVHDLAGEAQDATTEDARASLFGRYLATCGACHRLLQNGPDAEPPLAE